MPRSYPSMILAVLVLVAQAAPAVEIARKSGPYTAPSNIGAAGGVVADGGFEAGTPNPFWDEESTNFGTPICDLSACGLGGGSGPANGDWWAWFGGIGAFEEGAVRQEVTLGNGDAATLSFALEAPVCSGSSADFMEVLMDGTQLYMIRGDDPLCGQIGYTTIEIDASAYLGQTVMLEFHGINQGAGGDFSNFFVDDVEIMIDGCNLVMSLGRGVVGPGEVLPFTVTIEHNRHKTVTVPLVTWIEDAQGQIVETGMTRPHTFHQGDVLKLRNTITIPADFAPGYYRLVVGVDQMTQGEVWAQRPFRVE